MDLSVVEIVRESKMRVCSSLDEGVDNTSVGTESDFSRCIRRVISKEKSRRIIETGTFHGLGTTRTIAESISGDSVFYSIEASRENYDRAIYNLELLGLSAKVRVLHGLSLPSRMIPSAEETKWFIRQFEHLDIFVDHVANDRISRYTKEVSIGSGIEDDCLGKAMRSFGFNPDFILLDSAGHLGFLEFQYVCSQLIGPCIIAMDDTNHIKHWLSVETAKQDTSKFSVVECGLEKFGYSVLSFCP
jgi:hypothetical protein